MEYQMRNTYVAVLGTGFQRYHQAFYNDLSRDDDKRVVNLQVRYWIRAADTFHNLMRQQYTEDIIEEAVLIVNDLANSLQILGGVNWRAKGEEDRVPSLLELYDGAAFALKNEKPELYAKLEELNGLYNKLSKHFSRDRRALFSELTWAKLSELYHAARRIWLWVCNDIHGTWEFDQLFAHPDDVQFVVLDPNPYPDSD